MAPEQIDWIRAQPAGDFGADPAQLTVEMVVVNHGRKPFGDIRVRAAINHVLNREAITGKIRRVGDVPAYSIVPPDTANFPGGNSFDFKALPYDQRLAKARDPMGQAGLWAA